MFRLFVLFLLLTFSSTLLAQTPQPQAKTPFPKPRIIPHSRWQTTPPVGFPADGRRGNIAPGESLEFKELSIDLRKMTPAPVGAKDDSDSVTICLALTGESHPAPTGYAQSYYAEEKIIKEGAAFNWEGFHIAIIAAHTKKDELGYGLTEFEITTIASIPPNIARSTVAGGAAYRARISHKITMITLHHAGDPKPMTPQDDPIKKLRALQSWGAKDKNWWDVPYHFLISLDGTIYEGRDYHYIGETNTKYNPEGHFLISVMGNYEMQKPTPEQIKSITDLMAWAVQEFNVPLNKIYGHRDLADTDCPGKYLYSYLKDGTFKNGIKERLGMK
jgi:hypothetical protein